MFPAATHATLPESGVLENTWEMSLTADIRSLFPGFLFITIISIFLVQFYLGSLWQVVISCIEFASNASFVPFVFPMLSLPILIMLVLRNIFTERQYYANAKG